MATPRPEDGHMEDAVSSNVVDADGTVLSYGGYVVQYLPLAQLKPWAKNPKKHELEAIRRSIETFGFITPLTVNTRTGDNELVAGHGRLAVLIKMKVAGIYPPRGIIERGGEWYIPCVIVDMDEDEAAAFAVADNKTVELGGWDKPVLLDILKSLELKGKSGATGFLEADMRKLVASVSKQIAEENTPVDENKPTREDRVYHIAFDMRYEDSLILQRALEEAGEANFTKWFIDAAAAYLRGEWKLDLSDSHQ